MATKKTKEPFVKMRASLKDNPKPRAIGRALVKPDAKLAGLGAIFIAWSLCLQYGAKNKLPGYTAEDLDSETGKGFTAAAEAVGWAIVHPDGIEFPGLNNWQESLKEYREQAAQRMRNKRTESSEHVAQHVPNTCATVSPPELEVEVEEEQGAALPAKTRTAKSPLPPPPQRAAEPNVAAAVVLMDFGMGIKAAHRIACDMPEPEARRAVAWARDTGKGPGVIASIIAEGDPRPWLQSPAASTWDLTAITRSLTPNREEHS